MTQWDQKTRKTRRPRRIEEVNSAEIGFPVAWVLIGALSGLLIIGLVGLGVVNILRQQSITPTPSDVPGVAPTQEAEEQATTAPAVATATIPPVVTLEPTITPSPTATPVPTVPAGLAPDLYAKVINTGGAGVSMRAGPGTNNARLNVAAEGAIVLILEGPRADQNQEDFVWWFIRDPEGNEGWTVEEYLEPSLPPDMIDADSQ
jgi:hypothetical protein